MNQIQVELQDSFGTDRTIAESAWTSSLDYQKKKSRTEEDVKRVVEMLADQSHGTPFESIVFRFWIKMPISSDRQFMTHRIQSANGASARYRTMPHEFQSVPSDVDGITSKLDPNISYEYDQFCNMTNNWYQSIIKEFKQAEKDGKISNAEFKRVREFYRGILPQNNMTERVTTMNLRSFANFIKLRLSPHAQPEIRRVAELMLQEVKAKAKCPIAIEWLEKNGWEL